jgi:hypothetical protein
MAHCLVGIVFWALNIRGHIPQFGDYHDARRNASPHADTGIAFRIVGGFLASVALLALALWVVVWLAIRIL